MTSPRALYVGAVVVSSAFALAVAAWLWDDDLDLSGRVFVRFVFLHAVTGALVVGELLAPSRSLSVLFYGLHAATGSGVPVAFFLFALAFASRRREFPCPVVAAFAVYYTVVAGVQVTNPVPRFAWEGYEVVGSTVPHLQGSPTAVFTAVTFPLFFLYYAAMGVLGYRFLARQAASGSRRSPCSSASSRRSPSRASGSSASSRDR
jgi:hypothetical protein